MPDTVCHTQEEWDALAAQDPTGNLGHGGLAR